MSHHATMFGMARTCRSGMSAQWSRSGDERTTYAQCEFFAFCRVGPGNSEPDLSHASDEPRESGEKDLFRSRLDQSPIRSVPATSKAWRVRAAMRLALFYSSMASVGNGWSYSSR